MSPSSITPTPVTTAAEAADLAKHFAEVMELLIAIVQEETALVRAGRLGAAAKLAAHKDDLARLYMTDALRLRASQRELARIGTLDGLRRRHDTFRALLQINLTVLATAHAVSEGIVRGVSDELARKSAPQTYGASGRAVAPGRHVAPPLAVSRTL